LRVARIHASALIEDAAERFRSVHPATPLRLENRSDGAEVEVDRMMLRARWTTTCARSSATIPATRGC
jgi:hypothetical protein